MTRTDTIAWNFPGLMTSDIVVMRVLDFLSSRSNLPSSRSVVRIWLYCPLSWPSLNANCLPSLISRGSLMMAFLWGPHSLWLELFAVDQKNF